MKIKEMEIPNDVVEMAKKIVMMDILDDDADGQIETIMEREIKEGPMKGFKNAICAITACVNADGQVCIFANGTEDAVAVLAHDVKQKLEESFGHPLEVMILGSAKNISEREKSECNCPVCRAKRAACERKKSH